MGFDGEAAARVKRKVYLGDGAYVEHNGYAFVLTAENGIRATDTVMLEPEMFAMFREFVYSIYPELKR